MNLLLLLLLGFVKIKENDIIIHYVLFLQNKEKYGLSLRSFSIKVLIEFF